MSDAPRRPTCIGCPHKIMHESPIPMKKMGVMMHMGEWFCVGGRKARRFKRSDPKLYTPDWCPKRKNPCELRVYTYKSSEDRLMHAMLSSSLHQELSPEGYHYALKQKLHTELTPRKFWEQFCCESSAEPLSADVELHDVVEIDDGLKPVFFYKSEQGYQVVPHFNAETARKNKRED